MKIWGIGYDFIYLRIAHRMLYILQVLPLEGFKISVDWWISQISYLRAKKAVVFIFQYQKGVRALLVTPLSSHWRFATMQAPHSYKGSYLPSVDDFVCRCQMILFGGCVTLRWMPFNSRLQRWRTVQVVEGTDHTDCVLNCWCMQEIFLEIQWPRTGLPRHFFIRITDVRLKYFIWQCWCWFKSFEWMDRILRHDVSASRSPVS